MGDVELLADLGFFPAEIAHGKLRERQAEVGHGAVHDAGV